MYVYYTVYYYNYYPSMKKQGTKEFPHVSEHLHSVNHQIADQKLRKNLNKTVQLCASGKEPVKLLATEIEKQLKTAGHSLTVLCLMHSQLTT